MAQERNFIHEICSFLVEREIITHKQAEDWQKAFTESSVESFTNFLLEEGLIEKSHLLEALSAYYQVPFFDADGHFFDHALVHRFPKGVLLRNECVPLLVDDGNILIMVAAVPGNPDLLPIIGRYVSYDVRFMVGIARDICEAVKEFHEEALTEVTKDDEPI